MEKAWSGVRGWLKSKANSPRADLPTSRTTESGESSKESCVLDELEWVIRDELNLKKLRLLAESYTGNVLMSDSIPHESR